MHALLPLGQGLEAWWTYPERDIDPAFWIGLLATSVLIPPLTEEILIRGYQRVRLVESYGVMGGVVLTDLTTDETEGNLVMSRGWNVLTPFKWLPTPVGQIVIGGQDIIAVKSAVTLSSVTVTAELIVEVLG